MRLGRASGWLLLFALGLGCGGGRRNGRTTSDGAADAAPEASVEGGARRCTSDGDCDDALDCTLDRCAVGGVCRNEPLDELCPDGERCIPAHGCARPGRCASDEECDDADPCNGTETCSLPTGTCLPGTPMNCDDGDPCTEDACDSTRGSCTHRPSGRCDGGVSDSGTAPPFDPSRHYTGRFLVAPAPSLGCGMASYGFGEVRFQRTTEALRVLADWMTLEQRPPPDGPDFDVSLTHGSCSVMQLRGSFSNADEFTAQWTATMGSGCSLCPNQRQNIAGARAD